MTDAPQKPTWDDLKDLLRWFAMAFGQPDELWREEVVARALGLTIRGWLCALEAIARALLVLMAVELPKPDPKPRARARARRAKTTVIDPLTDDIAADTDAWKSERWAGVAFAYLALKRRRGEARARREEPLRFLPTRRLAFRLEALIRVAEAPERYAKRMAARLRRNPKHGWRVLRWPKPGGCPSFPEDDVARAQAFAWFALETFKFDSG